MGTIWFSGGGRVDVGLEVFVENLIREIDGERFCKGAIGRYVSLPGVTYACSWRGAGTIRRRSCTLLPKWSLVYQKLETAIS
jgi:hypothetical protein